MANPHFTHCPHCGQELTPPQQPAPGGCMVGKRPLPPADPAAGWAYVLATFPWIFRGINLKTEPYYDELLQAGVSLPDAAALPASDAAEESEAEANAARLEPYRRQLLEADGVQYARGWTRLAAKVLFGDPAKNGGGYLTKIEQAMEILTTTTPAGVVNRQNAA